MLVLVVLLVSLLVLIAIDSAVCLSGRRGWSRFIASFLLFYAQIIATEFILGFFGILIGWVLALINILIATGLLYWTSRTHTRKALKTYAHEIIQAPRRVFASLKNDPLWAGLVVVSAIVVLWIIFLGILFPATDFDGNSYHLTFIGNVLQYHTFFDQPTSLTWLNGYPKGGEFIALWPVLLSHSDMLADLAQVPFLALGIVSLYRISLSLGAEKRAARFSSLLFLFIPVVLNQLKTTYVDVMLATLFFAAIALVLQKKLSRLEYVLVGIIFSLLIAVKSTGILFIIAVLPLLAWNLYRNRLKRQKKVHLTQSYIFPLLTIAAPTIFGLYWYIKNLVVYGTPIYPFGFRLFGLQIFPGQTFDDFASNAVTNTALPNGCLERIWFVWTEQKDWFGCMYNYDANYTGLGPIWFVVLIPAILTAFYLAFRSKHRIFWGFAATILGLFAIYPSNYYSRYTLFIVALGIVSFALVLTKLQRKTVVLVQSLTLALALSVFFTNFTLCNFPPEMIKSQIKSLQAGSSRGAIYDNISLKPFAMLESKVRPGDVVVYDSKPYFIYPMWRPDYSNTVIYLKSNSKEDWAKQLKERKAAFVVTTLSSKEHPWTQSMTDTLTSIYKDELYEIFEVR
jgi:hypothetical protein